MVMEITARKGRAASKSYYREQEKFEGRDAWPPTWFGKGAERLGLSGIADHKIFARLIDNLFPDGKTKITPRGGDNRVVIHDLTFNCPKGLSLAAEFGPNGDEIRRAFIDAVQETIQERVEPLACTRERSGGRCDDTLTGEVTGTLYVHSVNRDDQPHLHAHACIQGHTWHPVENRHKALKVFGIHKAAPSIEEDYLSRLRTKVEDLGYRTENLRSKDESGPRRYWDLRDVPSSAKDKFNSRRSDIEKLYDAKKTSGQSVPKALRDKAGIMTRKPKTGQVDLEACRKLWSAQLTPGERDAFARLKDHRPAWGDFLKRAKRYHSMVRSFQHAGPGKEVEVEQQR